MHPNRPILGVDFSGAALAGEKIWVSRCHFDGETLNFDGLERAADLPSGSAERDGALAALRSWILSHESAACGLDFPFSLAREAIEDPDYASWLENFAARFPDAESLREGASHQKRVTDFAAKVPFAPLNLRLFRQTYYGIRDVLAPLHASGACILPFDAPQNNRLWLLEICPASLLKREKLYLSYKGHSAAQRQNREIIAREMQSRTPFRWIDAMKTRALDDTQGDALDAILAAICVHNALQTADFGANEVEKFEGKVYF